MLNVEGSAPAIPSPSLGVLLHTAVCEVFLVLVPKASTASKAMAWMPVRAFMPHMRNGGPMDGALGWGGGFRRSG